MIGIEGFLEDAGLFSRVDFSKSNQRVQQKHRINLLSTLWRQRQRFGCNDQRVANLFSQSREYGPQIAERLLCRSFVPKQIGNKITLM